MKKNKIVIIAFILLSLFVFAIKTKAVDQETLCADANTACYCLKTNSNSCTLQISAPSGHNYKMYDKTKCGCKSSDPQKYTPASSIDANGINLCQNAGVVKAAQIVGWMLFVIKILAPLILIIMGIIELAKAVISSDDKAISAAINALIKRAIAAVVIFFIPTIIALIFNIVGEASEAKTKFKCLSTCISNPSGCSIPSNDLFK